MGLLAYNAWPFLVRPSAVGDCIICGIIAAVTVAWLVFVILGHRKDWPDKWL